MRFDYEDVRYVISSSLFLLAAVLTVYLWMVDVVSMQKTFGALLACIFIILAMVIHVYSKGSYADVSKAWLLVGLLSLIAILLIAL